LSRSAPTCGRSTAAGGGVSTRPLEEILVGSGRTSLALDEAITEVAFAALGADQRATFAKIGSRSTVTVARLSVALVVNYDADTGVLTDARVALGAVGEAAFRDARLEELLEGRPANEESARLFAAGCIDAVRRAIPGRYSLPYKERAALGLAYDAWNALGLCERCEPVWG
jgi:CO/xanthine dehydrogenase FAD-binding subunit